MVYKDKLTAREVVDRMMGKEFYTLVRTVHGEARGELPQGQVAIVHVILNRVRKQRKAWGLTVKDVCLKPKQFSYWDLTTADDFPYVTLTSFYNIASKALTSYYPSLMHAKGRDITKGATHYHKVGMKNPPKWSIGKVPCVIIGNHAFYNNIY